jgi:hypothetical protein
MTITIIPDNAKPHQALAYIDQITQSMKMDRIEAENLNKAFKIVRSAIIEEPLIISLNKRYQTKCGLEVRINHIKDNEVAGVIVMSLEHALLLYRHNYKLSRWTINGVYKDYVGPNYDGRFDLVEVDQ